MAKNRKVDDNGFGLDIIAASIAFVLALITKEVWIILPAVIAGVIYGWFDGWWGRK